MSGMNLMDMILQAQGGRSVQTAGRTVGLNKAQTTQAIAALLPALSSALKQNTQTPEGLAGLLQALQRGNHDQYLDTPATMKNESSVLDGNAILGHLFGSKDVSRAVAGHASQKTGIKTDLLKKLLPLVATMAMGSLSKQTREPTMQEQLTKLALEQMSGGGRQRQPGLGGLLGGLFGGQARQQKRVQQQHQQGLGILGNLLDADGDGSVMDDVLGMAMKAASQRA
ncbi:MAG: DUF937 domain-containing protein [Hellea sp.]|nr:DUF937 domain-containing protein [Hellea sp.]